MKVLCLTAFIPFIYFIQPSGITLGITACRMCDGLVLSQGTAQPVFAGGAASARQ